ncbi:hypothetical protein diail_3818 [Diaporthe ilicicola]|nr:hypothetical protein diail_3818 [Diaporthe ilicicola]
MGSVPLSGPFRLAILVTDEPLPSVAAKLGGFDNIFTSLLRAACESLDPPRTLESELEISAHDVVAGDPDTGTTYPDPQSIDAVLITGSKHSAYADDDWIVRLTAYTRRLLDEGRVRVLGVCFGHQIVARALGARVARSPSGWELSVTQVELTEEGKRVFRAEDLKIYQMHRDAVMEYQPGVIPLACTEQCPIQAMYIPRLLLTVQGHPEFSQFIMSEFLQARHQAGKIRDGPFQDAKMRMMDEHDGVLVAQTFLRFLRE